MLKQSKVFIFIWFSIFLLIALLIITIIKEESIKNKSIILDKEEKEEKNIIEYKANQTIRVKMCSTSEIVAMDVNDYLRGVLPAEMPPYYDIEALKAQAIVARTYLYRKMSANAEGEDCDVCDNYAHCQAFYNKEKILQIWANKGYDEKLRNEYYSRINEAVVSTQNEVIMYNNQYIRAYFHASSPVATESSSQIWGREEIPYLVSVKNIESEEYPNRTSNIEVSYDDFLNLLKTKIDSSINIDKIKCEDIKINEYTTSGRIKDISVCGYIISAEKLRIVYDLRSTLFTIKNKENSVVFNVIGNGHGIGMSQVGADYYAKNGMKYKDIIKHYYTGVEIVKL